ncbi:helix-turn-helix transcriptional regulator [uncultured Anaerotruncus sp.]|uniref:helix-turn-helix domain-containing protein n=1 Tax=uncultured Anaerotruncus sp. TaxID=905011 RepID=UPI00280AD150|nr:helix-turn-helix transcriptional regulator [uncultured Anaerotruncus sp.]
MTVANLGQIIKHRRERMKISQENLADLAGISTKLLSDIECGRANPTFETMDLVAAALGVELEELLQPEQVIDLLPQNDLSRYQQMLDRLPPFAQRMVIAGLEGAIAGCMQLAREM